jgi:hypothetical protein
MWETANARSHFGDEASAISVDLKMENLPNGG